MPSKKEPKRSIAKSKKSSRKLKSDRVVKARAAVKRNRRKAPKFDYVQLATRWFDEIWNQRRTETAFELLTAESTCQSEVGVLRGPKAFIDQVYSPFVASFPDVRVTIEGIVADGEQVVVRWWASGTPTGGPVAAAATGRKISFRGMTWIRFENGKMMEGWDSWNQNGVSETLKTGIAAASVSLV